MSLWAALAPTSGEPVSSSPMKLIVVLTPPIVAPPAALNASTAITEPLFPEIPKVAEPPVSGSIPPRLTTCSVGLTSAFLHPTPTPAISAQTRIMASSLLMCSPLLIWICGTGSWNGRASSDLQACRHPLSKKAERLHGVFFTRSSGGCAGSGLGFLLTADFGHSSAQCVRGTTVWHKT